MIMQTCGRQDLPEEMPATRGETVLNYKKGRPGVMLGGAAAWANDALSIPNMSQKSRPLM